MSVVEISKTEVIQNLMNVKTRSKKQQTAIDEAEQLINLLWEQVKQTPQSRFDEFKKIYTINMEVMEMMNDELKEENEKLHNSENVLRNHLNLRNKNINDNTAEIKSLKQQIRTLELSKK